MKKRKIITSALIVIIFAGVVQYESLWRLYSIIICSLFAVITVSTILVWIFGKIDKSHFSWVDGELKKPEIGEDVWGWNSELDPRIFICYWDGENWRNPNIREESKSIIRYAPYWTRINRPFITNN